MKYVREHLTTEHLLHAPHHWFMAFLLSPIHALETHYQKAYHLKFSHARKLFIFDMLLLASIVVLFSATLYWYWYDPTITKQVQLDFAYQVTEPLSPDSGRILSGEEITLTANYTNNSTVELTQPVLQLKLPAGFILHYTDQANFVTSTRSISLLNLLPKTGGQLTLVGQFFSEPNVDTPIQAELVYQQKNSQRFEVKESKLLAITRGSVLQINAQAPTTIYHGTSWDMPVIIKNISRAPVTNVRVSLQSNTEATKTFTAVTIGENREAVWNIPVLPPQETATATAHLIGKFPVGTAEFTASVIPAVIINDQEIRQGTISARSTVVHPEISLTHTWDKTTVIPGQNTHLTLNLKNTGSITLNNASVTIPLPTGLINVNQLAALNHTAARNNTLIFTAQTNKALQQITPNEEIILDVVIPVTTFPIGQTNSELNVPVKFSATTNQSTLAYEQQITVPGIKVGTNLRLIPQGFYYSPEGDQIGRGPLPPRVGKETKYWAMITLQNSTSEVNGVTLSGTLAPHVVWTGKTTVSQGREPSYNATTRTFTWQVNTLAAQENVQINVELALTPEANQINTSPLLLTNLRASGQDSFIAVPVSVGPIALDSSLRADALAQEKGTLVQ